MSRRYRIATDVATLIGAAGIAQIRSGQAAPAAYACLTCRQPGHAEKVNTSVIVHLDDTSVPNTDHLVIGFAHARCAPSEILPAELLRTPHAAAAAAEATRRDVSIGWYGPYPALLSDEPPGPAHLTADGRRDLGQAVRLAEGFGIAMSTTPPMLPDGWAVVVTDGALTGIAAPDGGWWWQSDAAGAVVAIPQEWLDAGRTSGLVAILAGDFRFNEMTGKEGDYERIVGDAMGAGRIVYGLATYRQ